MAYYDIQSIADMYPIDIKSFKEFAVSDTEEKNTRRITHE